MGEKRPNSARLGGAWRQQSLALLVPPARHREFLQLHALQLFPWRIASRTCSARSVSRSSRLTEAPSDALCLGDFSRVFDARQIPAPQLMALLLQRWSRLCGAGSPEELTAFYDGTEAGLPAAEREQRLAAIDAELLELQRLRRILDRELAGAGIAIDRRADVDPRYRSRARGITVPGVHEAAGA